MTNDLFIDDQYLKEFTTLGKSMDVDEIYPFVGEAQVTYVQDVLGTPLYDYLVGKIPSGTASYTSYEWNLIEIISKALAYWTVYMALPSLGIKIRNLGVVRPTSDYTQSSPLEELKYIREENKNMAEFWMQRAVNYLTTQCTHFPLYSAASNDMYPSNVQYDSDIYIEDGYKDLTWEEIRFLKKYLG